MQQAGASARSRARALQLSGVRTRARCAGPARRSRVRQARRCCDPTARRFRADWRCRLPRCRRAWRAPWPALRRWFRAWLVQISRASCSTQPDCGKYCGNSRCAHGDCVAGLVEQDGARAGGALIERQDVSRHVSILRASQASSCACGIRRQVQAELAPPPQDVLAPCAPIPQREGSRSRARRAPAALLRPDP